MMYGRLTKIGMSGLIWASKNNHTDLAKFLIKAKSNVNQKDLINRSALFHAVKNKNHKLVKELLRRRADPWSVGGQQPYDVLCDYDRSIMGLINLCRTVDLSKIGGHSEADGS